MTALSRQICIQWYQYFRYICTNHLIRNPYQIGGVGHIVQIDESLMAKRKSNVGREVPQRWVFGGYDTSIKQGFIVFVPNRNKGTLEGEIKKYIKPGTEIHSDCWTGYNAVSNIDVNPSYIHKTVNHSLNFVDPVTKTHTNSVECYWKNCKRKFKRMLGVHSTMVESYLDEFLWREMFGKDPNETFENLLVHNLILKLYGIFCHCFISSIGALMLILKKIKF